MSKTPKPIGSGVFALAAGIVFFIGLIYSFFHNLEELKHLNAYAVLQTWLLFAATILTIWGTVRVLKVLAAVSAAKQKKVVGDAPKVADEKEDDKPRWEIGQPTLNFVVGIVAATAAIVALIVN